MQREQKRASGPFFFAFQRLFCWFPGHVAHKVNGQLKS